MTDPADGDRLPAVSRTSSILRATGAGVASGAVGIAVSELVAGVIPGAPSLVVAVGSFVIAKQPAGAKDLVATLFGTNDKLALNIAVVVVALLVAAVLRTRLPLLRTLTSFRSISGGSSLGQVHHDQGW